MPNRDALAGLRQVQAAIEVMIRSGRFDTARLAELAREGRRYCDQMAGDRSKGTVASRRPAALEEHPS